jgi:hypothetical protein
MDTQINDQWILDRINTSRVRQGTQKGVWPARNRRVRDSRWVPLSTEAIRLLDKHPKWIDRDM